MNNIRCFFVGVALRLCNYMIAKTSSVDLLVGDEPRNMGEWIKRKNLYYITQIIEARIEIPYSGFEAEGFGSSSNKEHAKMLKAYNLGVETAVGETKAASIKILGEYYVKT